MNFDVTNRRRAGERADAAIGRPASESSDELLELGVSAHVLTTCEGFLVDGPDGPIGVVDEVLLNRDTGLAETLSVQVGGVIRPQIRKFPVAAVAEIFPSERRLFLRARAQPTKGRSRLARWLDRIRPS